MTTSLTVNAALRRRWWLALTLFLVAAGTGAWLRFGSIYGFPGGLQFFNMRHAHSHLMYFGWVTPALMTLMAAHLAATIERPLPQGLLRAIDLTLVMAVLAYPPFLLYGYRTAVIAGRALPLSVMAAGLNVLGWYVFAWQYRRATRGMPQTFTLHLWDTAVLFLLYASLGGWGLPLLTLLNIENPLLSVGLTHLFLDEFADGWFVLAILGLLYAAHPAAAQNPMARRSHDLLVFGLPVVFLLGIPTHLLTWPLQLVGGLGGLLVGLGLLGHLAVLWPQAKAWRVPLFFLGLKALGQLAITLPPVARWAELNALRVPYLHWLLLGFVTVGLLTAVPTAWGTAKVTYQRWFVTAVILLQLSLLPLTRLWPAPWSGPWVRQVAAWAALGPVLVALLWWASNLSNQQLFTKRRALSSRRFLRRL